MASSIGHFGESSASTQVRNAGDWIDGGNTDLPTAAGSIAFWFYPYFFQGMGAAYALFEAQKDATNLFNITKWSDNKIYAGWYTAASNYRVVVDNANYTLNTKRWNSLVLTWDDSSNDTKLYLNGDLIGSNTSLVTHTGHGTKYIGSDDSLTIDAASNFAHFAIWPRVLTHEQVKLFDEGAFPDDSRMGPRGKHYWTFSNSFVDRWGGDHAIGTGTKTLPGPPRLGQRPPRTYFIPAAATTVPFVTGGTTSNIGHFDRDPGGYGAAEPGRHYDGSSGYLYHAASIASSYPLSFSAWIWSSSTSNYHTIISTGHTGNTTDYIWFTKWNTGELALQRSTSAGFYKAITTNTIPLNKWVHVCAVIRSATSMSIWIDGGQKTTDTNSVPFPTANNISVGVLRRSSILYHFDGNIFRPFIYAAALTDAEVVSLAKNYVYPWEVRPDKILGAPHGATRFDPYLHTQFQGLGTTAISHAPPIQQIRPPRWGAVPGAAPPAPSGPPMGCLSMMGVGR